MLSKKSTTKNKAHVILINSRFDLIGLNKNCKVDADSISFVVFLKFFLGRFTDFLLKKFMIFMIFENKNQNLFINYQLKN
jgi:hypothetical protein